MLISSAKNPRAKHICELRERKIREGEGVTVLEGYRELSRALDAGIVLTECWHCPAMYLGENEPALLDRAAKQGAEIFETTPTILAKMAYRERPEGLIAVAKVRHIGLEEMPVVPNGLYLIAETIEKPGWSIWAQKPIRALGMPFGRTTMTRLPKSSLCTLASASAAWRSIRLAMRASAKGAVGVLRTS